MDTKENELAEYFAYLDDLRDSGVTNMYGAGAYLQEEFEMGRKDASAVLQLWMSTFDASLTAEERAAKAQPNT